MKCRHCGSQIADNALICYRCGAATAEPRFKAPAGRGGRSPLTMVTTVLVVILIALCVLYAVQFASGGAPAATRWAIAAAAASIIAIRLVGRRRR